MPGSTLLVGGGGFIGQALARRLVARDQAVTVLSRRAPENLVEGARWLQGGVDDTGPLHELLDETDAVVYLATTSTPGRNIQEPSREARENLLPLLRFLEILNEHPRIPFIYLSSGGSIYGNPTFLPVDESHALAPLSYHAAGKAAAEQFLGVFGHQGHIVSILRPANVYGPGQPMQAGFGVIRTVLEHLRRNTPMTLWGDGEAVRDYLYIDDIVDACLAALGAPKTGTFNIGSGCGLSLKALCELAEEITGRRLELHYRPARGVDFRAVMLDHSAFSEHYGWQPRTEIGTGMAATWDWLRNQP